MKSKTKKIDELKSLEQKLPSSAITVISSFSRAGEKGLSVAQMSELKRLLRSVGAEYVVTKKTLIDRAIRDLKLDGLDIFGVDGSVGLVVGQKTDAIDGYAIAKKIYEFSKKNQALQFFGAFFDGTFIDKEKFLEMAKMPSREMLLARLFGMLKYPVAGFYLVLNEVAKKKESATS